MTSTELPIISLFNSDETDYLIPEYKTPMAAAVDLRARLDSPITIPSGVFTTIPLGVQLDMSNHPNLCALIIPRSGLGSAGITLMNCVGLIDPDYQGELQATLLNQTDSDIRINRGDRIVQMLFCNFTQVSFKAVQAFTNPTERGDKGHGHTGIK